MAKIIKEKKVDHQKDRNRSKDSQANNQLKEWRNCKKYIYKG